MLRMPMLKPALILVSTMVLCSCVWAPPGQPWMDEELTTEAQSAYEWYLMVTAGMTQAGEVEPVLLELIATEELAANTASHLQLMVDSGAMLEGVPTTELFELIDPHGAADVAAHVCSDLAGAGLVDRVTGADIDLGDTAALREVVVTFERDDDGELLIAGRASVPEHERACQ